MKIILEFVLIFIFKKLWNQQKIVIKLKTLFQRIKVVYKSFKNLKIMR
jgi:hypothetical protein